MELGAAAWWFAGDGDGASEVMGLGLGATKEPDLADLLELDRAILAGLEEGV